MVCIHISYAFLGVCNHVCIYILYIIYIYTHILYTKNDKFAADTIVDKQILRLELEHVLACWGKGYGVSFWANYILSWDHVHESQIRNALFCWSSSLLTMVSSCHHIMIYPNHWDKTTPDASEQRACSQPSPAQTKICLPSTSVYLRSQTKSTECLIRNHHLKEGWTSKDSASNIFSFQSHYPTNKWMQQIDLDKLCVPNLQYMPHMSHPGIQCSSHPWLFRFSSTDTERFHDCLLHHTFGWTNIDIDIHGFSKQH